MSHLDIVHFGLCNPRLYWVGDSGRKGLSSGKVEPINGMLNYMTK